MCSSDKDIALYSSLNYCIAVPTQPEDGTASIKWPETSEPAKKGHFIGVYRKTNPDGTWATPADWGGVPDFLKKFDSNG